MIITHIRLGESFYNKWMPDFTFKILGVWRKQNILHVKIVPNEPKRFAWEEDWNLLHCEVAFENGDYKILNLV